jgi:hypothetical protein
MNIQNKMKCLIAAFALLLMPFFAQAQQNTLTGTTLGAAVTNSATLVQVAATTGISTSPNVGYNTAIYVDQELMTVLNVNGLVLTVARGQSGTRAAAHASGAVVYAGRPTWFYPNDPAPGPCVLANVIATPWINVRTGNHWQCSGTLLVWVPGFGNPGNSGIPVNISTTVTAATATPISGPLFKLTGSTTITSFTIPVGGVGYGFCMIPDSTNTVSTGNNIALGSTLVVNKTECYTWDAGASKYVPSY